MYYVLNTNGQIINITGTEPTDTGALFTLVEPADTRMWWNFDTSTWYWHKSVLRGIADDRRVSISQSTFTIGGVVYPYNNVNTDYLQALVFMGQFMADDAQRAMFYNYFIYPQDVVLVDNEDMLEGFWNHWQEFEKQALAYQAVVNGIESDTITTLTALDAEWMAVANAYVAPARLPSYAETVATVATLNSPPDELGDLAESADSKHFTDAEKTKLAGVQAGAINAAAVASQISTAIGNLVGAAPASLDTLKEIADALGNNANLASTLTASIATKANASDLTTLAARVTALENWRSAVKVARMEAFSGTTDANGDVTVTTSIAFTSPKVIATPRGTAGAEGYHATVTSVSGTSISVRVFKNKTQGVLIGGTIDPDAPHASGAVDLLVVQAA